MAPSHVFLYQVAHFLLELASSWFGLKRRAFDAYSPNDHYAETLKCGAFQDNARRAALDQKVGHWVDTGVAGMNRQMQPRFSHGFLCHSDVSGSIDRSVTR